MNEYYKLNPLFKIEYNNQCIIVKNIFNEEKVYEVKSKNVDMLYKFINEFSQEENKLEEVINRYENKYHEFLRKFVNGLLNKVFLIKYSKNDYFFTLVLEKTKKMIQSKDKVNFQQLIRILVNKIPNIKTCIIYDKENEQYINEFDKYYFNSISHCNLDVLDNNEVEDHLINNDLYIILINHSNFDKLDTLNKHIRNSDKTIVLMQYSNNQISIGPLLLPKVLGCIHCLKLALMDVRNMETIKYRINEKGSEIIHSLINSYLYNEILNFYIDKLSNYSTSYSKLLGTQISIDLDKNSICKINAMKDPKCEICY